MWPTRQPLIQALAGLGCHAMNLGRWYRSDSGAT
jgi:hypothetical protein